MTFIFFNLLVNSILSLVIGLIIVYFFIWFFRIETERWKVFILSLPFVKILYDVVRGVPEKSILFSGVDPFNLPPKHQGTTFKKLNEVLTGSLEAGARSAQNGGVVDSVNILFKTFLK